MADAHSPAGALGLMQLMPATVKLLTAKIGWTYTKIQDLFDVATNVHFGSQYLQQLAKNYQSNLILASAAYNAGPGRVKYWLQQRPNLASDIWVDTIPWHETRDYVKNVLAYTIIYESHLGMTPGPQKPLLGLFN